MAWCDSSYKDRELTEEQKEDCSYCDYCDVEILNDDKGLIDMGMASAYAYAERLYKAGYRKVE